MKKTLLSILALSAGVAFAQKVNFATVPSAAAGFIKAEKAPFDTLILDGGPCSQEGLLWVTGFGGTSSAPSIVSQQGNIDMTEIAQAYSHATGGKVSTVFAIIADKWVGGANGTSNFQAKIYSIVNNKPGALLGTSNNVSYSNVDTSLANGVTVFTFATPVTVGTEFAVALTLTDGTANTDSIAVLGSFPFNTQAPQGSIAQIEGPCAQGTSFFKIVNGANSAWVSYAENFDPATPAEFIDPKLFIGAVVDLEGVSVVDNNTISYTIFPNPTSDVLNVQYTLANAGTVSMNVVDLTGRVVRNIVKENQGAFQATEQINIAGLNAGIYLLNVTANGNTTTQKFIVK